MLDVARCSALMPNSLERKVFRALPKLFGYSIQHSSSAESALSSLILQADPRETDADTDTEAPVCDLQHLTNRCCRRRRGPIACTAVRHSPRCSAALARQARGTICASGKSAARLLVHAESKNYGAKDISSIHCPAQTSTAAGTTVDCSVTILGTHHTV
ncbi:DUF4333 domain-containing protein [Rhodococcus erythropolis]|uniref:DUF4333 domain-containing protein n=1 Tax=Rhodococcus erythropolis TaxID=1833 RepID=UPI0009C14176